MPVLFGGHMNSFFEQRICVQVSAVETTSPSASGWTSRPKRALRFLRQSDPFQYLPLTAFKSVTSKKSKMVGRAFFEIQNDQEGLTTFMSVSELIKLRKTAGFMQSDRSVRTTYRYFYKNAPQNLR